jgi:hypothetical protein
MRCHPAEVVSSFCVKAIKTERKFCFAQCVSRLAGIDFVRILSSVLRRSKAPASESRNRAQTIPSTVLGPFALGVETTVAE